MKLATLGKTAVVLLSLLFPANGRVSAQITAVTAGTLIDPDTGTEKAKQTILIDGRTIVAVGSELQIPSDAKRIDLSHETVLPGLIDAHTHLLASVDAKWDLGDFWIMAIQRRAGWRAIQGVQHAKEMLESGFTTVRDVGNSGDHLDTDLDKAIRFGLVPGPTMVFSGRIIAPFGGQFWDTPADPRLLDNPEYRFADSRDAQHPEHLLGRKPARRRRFAVVLEGASGATRAHLRHARRRERDGSARAPPSHRPALGSRDRRRNSRSSP